MVNFKKGEKELSELKALISKAKKKDEKSMEKLFIQFKPLLKSRASRYSRYGLEYEDVFQQASLIFILAVYEFEEKRGIPFSGYIKKILKEYSIKKIEEKLDLLMERKNIQSPAGWLRAALKNDYRGEERETYPISHPHLNPPPSKGEETRRMDSRLLGNDIWRCGNDKCRGVLQYAPPQNIITSSDLSEHGNLNSPLPSPLAGEGKDEGDRILSTEEARERFKLLREKLMAIK